MGTFAEVCSVFADGREEALRHKWIESQRANRDLGEEAIRQWVRAYWWEYIRARWMEHVRGIRLWQEFHPDAFGVLRWRFEHHGVLVDRIVDRLAAGQENLDVIQWAIDWRIPMEPVIEVLTALDINSCRLSCNFVHGH